VKVTQWVAFFTLFSIKALKNSSKL